MGRALSRDLRDRVVAAVEGGVSCRRAAERFGVSAASAIRWRQLALAHRTPAARPQGGDRRTAKIEEHASFILNAIEQQPDPTLAELREMLAARGERWLGEFGQRDEWIAGLRAARMAAAQEA